MATHRNPGLPPDSHQESESLWSSNAASAEELKAFYEDAERRDTLERKLSQRKSSTPSMWSRKSLKRNPTAPPPQTSSDTASSPFSTVRSQSLTNGDAGPSEASGTQPEKTGQFQLTPSRSAIVDSRPNAPRNDSDPWASVPQPSVKRSYPLHNPLGPRWYKNHHLIPPSHTKPSMRPPTFFSPSFPPISTSSMVDPGDDEPGLSRTPSGSPLPTPTSSQTRVMDKPRSRKTSQTTPDNVDYLDVTDPWGSTYHHTSPYDVFGQTTTSQDHPARPRRASMTTAQAHKSTIPSPLSQSTSAVHLHGTQTTIHIPRKLSKRKTTPAAHIFPSQPADHERQASSAPPTPIDNRYQADSPIGDENSTTLPKRMSVGPPLQAQPAGTPKREKRTSMLGRLVKKFSILKKSSEPTTTTFPGYSHSRSNSTTHAHHADHVDRTEPTDPQPQHSDPPADENRDIPVEPAHIPPAPKPKLDPPVPPPDKADQSSIISLELPYSIGRLTVANPDLDAEEPLSPAPPPAPPSPPRKVEEPVPPSPPSPPSPPPAVTTAPPAEAIIPPEVEVQPSSIVQSPPPQPPVRLSRFDKPLPPPVPPTPSAPSVALDDCSDSSSSMSSDSSSEDSDDETEAPNTTAAPAPDPSPDPVPTPPPVEAVEQPKEAEHEDTLVKEAKEEEVPKENLVIVPPQPPVKSSPPTSPSTVTGVKSRTPPQASPSPPPVALHKRISSQRSTLNSSPRINGVASPPPPSELKVTSPPPKAPSPLPKPIQPTTTGDSRKSRSYSRSQQIQSPPPPPVAVPSMIPFPTKSMDRLPTAEELGYPIAAYFDSPFSASSVLANPPTPYDHRLSIATSSVPPSLPAKDIYEKPMTTTMPPVPPSKSSPTRQTEVFKLVRSSSGNVYASGQTIVAGGQQWEVIESSTDTMGRKKGKEKEKERETLVVPSSGREREREREKSTSYSRHEQSGSYDASTRRESKMRVVPEPDDRRYSKSRYRSSGHGHSEEDQSPTKVNGKHSSRRYEDRTYHEDKDRERRRDRDDSRRYKEDESRKYKEDDPRTRGEREERRWREEREERKRREEREERKRREEKEERKRQEEKEKKRKEEREERKRKEEERRLYEEYEERKRIEEERRRAEREERKRQEEWIRQEEERRAKEEEERLRKEEEDRRKDEDRRRRQEEERARWEEQERKRRDEEEDRRVMEERRRREEEERKAEERKRREEREERKRQEEYRRQQEARKRQEEEYTARKKLEDEYRRQQEELANEERRRREREERDKHRKEERPRKDDRRRSKKPDEPSTSSSSQAPRADTSNKPAAPLPRLERGPSLNARPTSQLPSAAEMNAMRAKESWELDRLWKARSMYGLEPDGVVNDFIPGPGSISSKSDDTPEPVHGSSHTAFVVASPFHHHQSPMNSIYHSMPLQPPPIIYSSPAAASTIPSIPDTFSNYDPYEYQMPASRPKATAAATTTTTRGPSALSRPPLNNPLPEPPRESTYEPAPLHNDSRYSWSKYSFTTAN